MDNAVTLRTTLRLPLDLHAKLTVHAAGSGVSFNTMVISILRAALGEAPGIPAIQTLARSALDGFSSLGSVLRRTAASAGQETRQLGAEAPTEENMGTIHDSLAELTVVTRDLNAETDALNETIRSIERRIAATHVGLTTWVNKLVCKSELRNVSRDGVDGALVSAANFNLTRGWQIGYMKLDSEWHIVASQVEVAVPTNGSEQPKADDMDEPILLTQAPRIVRMEAAALLEELVRLLIAKSRDYLSAVRTANERL